MSTRSTTNTIQPRISKGFSLVELMVAMAIGLIVSLAVFSALSTFEGRKRTSTSVNDTEQAGNYAIFEIEKLVRNAGAGITQKTDDAFDYLLCSLAASKSAATILPATPPTPFNNVTIGTAGVFRLAPALILPGQTTPGVSGQASDVLAIMASASGRSEVASPFQAAPTSTRLAVFSNAGYAANDIILVARKGGLGNCLIQQVGSLDNADVNNQGLNLAGTHYAASPGGVALVSSDFCSTATTPAVASVCNVLNLGSTTNPPLFALIGVGDNNTLFSYDLLRVQGDTAQQIADGVFEMHARYGVDSNNDGRVDTWASATGAYAPASLMAADGSGIANLCRIKAIRVGLITRSDLREKEDVADAAITLFQDLPAAVQHTRNLSGDALKFRYKTLESTIPLRSMLGVCAS